MKKLFYSIFTLFFILSCEDSIENIDIQYTIKTSKDIINLQTDDKLATVTVETNLNEWFAQLERSEDASWITIESDNDAKKITFLITENKKAEARSAVILIGNADQSTTTKVTVNQLGLDPALFIDKYGVEDVLSKVSTVNFTVTSNVDYTISLSDDWISENSTRSLQKYKHTLSVEENIGVKRTTTVIITTVGITPEIVKTFNVRQAEGAPELTPDDDILISPIAAIISDNFQGLDGEYACDANFETLWMSSNDGVFPKTIEFTLPDDIDIVNYALYNVKGTSGCFGKTEIYYNTKNNAQWMKIKDYDFNKVTGSQTVYFAAPIVKPKSFKFVINDGANKLAACSEMEFYKFGDNLKELIPKVFTSTTCTKLIDNVKEADIAALPEIYKNIANKLRSNTYTKEFRIDHYIAHSSPELWATKFKHRVWGKADNPTGIWVERGEKINVLVGETWGNQIKLLCCDPEDGAGGVEVELKGGLNVLSFSKAGLLYVKYYVNDLKVPTAKPIEIHIPEGFGVLNGYWDIQKHKTDEEFARIFALGSAPAFDIVGKYCHMIFARSVIPSTKIVEPFSWYERMCQWDNELLGIDYLYNEGEINHRHVMISDSYSSSPNASAYRTCFPNRTAKKMLNGELIKENGLWGPAHEIGHQLQGALNYHGCTEVSNNLFSNLMRWKTQWMETRGRGVEALNKLQYPVLTQYLLLGDGILQARMYWQLYTYYHSAGKKVDFWPNYFRLLEKTSSNNPQQCAMNNYILACDAAGEDLTEFFTTWGLFVPFTKVIEDYTTATHTLTQKMIDDAQKKVKDKNYPKAAPIQYIDDRFKATTTEQNVGDAGFYLHFKENAKLKSNIAATWNGENFAIVNGEGAAAFELKLGDVILFRSVMYSFPLKESEIPDGAKLYAVQVDGTRKEIWIK